MTAYPCSPTRPRTCPSLVYLLLASLSNLLRARIIRHCTEKSGNAPPLTVVCNYSLSSTPHARNARVESTPICKDKSAFNMNDA
eukprot:5469167-Pyramimonas_sp.AAC.1